MFIKYRLISVLKLLFKIYASFSQFLGYDMGGRLKMSRYEVRSFLYVLNQVALYHDIADLDQQVVSIRRSIDCLLNEINRLSSEGYQ